MRLVAHRELIRLRRGLYADAQRLDHILIANRLVSPSYVSFETALGHYGMIPERVEAIMSVTTHRGTKFSTPVGLFQFRNQKVEIFSSSYSVESKDGYSIRIATREKALLDTVARMRVPATTMTTDEARRLVVEDLRIDESSLKSLSIRELRRLVSLYTSHAVAQLVLTIS